jgi:hypothetical protein
MNRLRTWLTAALLALLAVCLAAPALVAPALAAPSLWHVKGSQGDVWLFG